MSVTPREGRKIKFIRIETAHVPYKKWKAFFQDENGREFIRYFGGKHADGTEYTDYTRGATEFQREAYRRRHAHDCVKPQELAKKYNDELYLASPGILSYEILWGDSQDIKENIRRYKKTYLNSNFFLKHNDARTLQGEESKDAT